MFGGLYLHHLRSAVFENLIRAEAFLGPAAQNGHPDGTGYRVLSEKFPTGARFRVVQKDAVSFFNPAYGAALEEWDYLPQEVNLMCNVQRQPEPYHQMVSGKMLQALPFSIHQFLGMKDKDLAKHLFYDASRRLSFLDRFFAASPTLEDFRRSACADIGNFVGSPYKLKKGGVSLCFEKAGEIRVAGRMRPVVLTKTVRPEGRSAVAVRYAFRNPGDEPLRFVFGAEFNFSIGEERAAKGVSEQRVREWIFNDSWRGIRIRLSSGGADCGFLATPVETVSESECGLERTYQGLSALMHRPFTLAPGASAEQEFRLEAG